MKNPCLQCDHHLTGGKKDAERCLACRDRIDYVRAIGAGDGLRYTASRRPTAVAASHDGPPATNTNGEARMENEPKNKLIDLNDALFDQLRRIQNPDLKGADLEAEIKRSKAVGFMASQIIGNARVALDAQVKVNEYLIKNPPRMLGSNGYEEK